MTGLLTRRQWLFVLGLAVTVVYLIPVYWMVNTSFKEAGDIFASPPDLVPLPPTTESYESAVFSNSDIARGLTNAEVAAALFLAERTVASHLTHVYAKLSVTSRMQLAREAARHPDAAQQQR